MKVKHVSISEITINNRARTDMGDIDTLVDSIKEKGLLQPITLDNKLNLIAGHRRLTAFKQIGEDKIPAVIRESGDIDTKEIELYENIHRKDFSWDERAKLEKEIFDLWDKFEDFFNK